MLIKLTSSATRWFVRMLRARNCAPARPSLPRSAPRPAPILPKSLSRPSIRLHGTTPGPAPAPQGGGVVVGFVKSMGKGETWKRWWEIAKAEGRHYKHGTVVFWDNLKAAKKIYSEKVQKQKRLTRSERLHMGRTALDFLKLGNLIPIVVIPAAEFALPVLLKVFPGFLPSTYATTEQVQGKLNANLKQKGDIINALQASTEEIFKSIRFESHGLKPEDAAASWQRMRTGTMPLATQEIIHFAALFHELFALDKLPRQKLVQVCKFFNLPSRGTDKYLINNIRIKMRVLREDDEEILEEGIYNLSEIDLREANVDRGVRGVKLEKVQLHKLLHEWIELSSHALPPYLLVLSRSFTLSEGVNAKIAELEKLEKRIEKLEKVAPETATKEKEKLEAVKEEVTREVEKEAVPIAPPVVKVVAAAAETKEADLKVKILEVASKLASASEEAKSAGSTITAGTTELSKKIEAMIDELEKDEKADQNKRDKIWLLQQFASYDMDKNNAISASELKEVLERMGERLPDESIVQLMEKVDTNKDGQISFDEFLKAVEVIFAMKAEMAKQEAKMKAELKAAEIKVAKLKEKEAKAARDAKALAAAAKEAEAAKVAAAAAAASKDGKRADAADKAEPKK